MDGTPMASPQTSTSRTYRPCSRSLPGEDSFGNCDLLVTRGLIRHPDPSISVPGTDGELESAVEAVTGRNRPITTRLTGSDSIPD